MHTICSTSLECLVRRSTAGSREAFTSLVDRYGRWIRTLCSSRMQSDEVDDFVQEVFLRAFVNLGRLSNPRLFTAYLGRIARNLCIDQLRARRRRLRSLDELEREPEDPRTGAPRELDELGEILSDDLAELPPRQREALTLFYFENMSHAEVAAALGTTLAAVNNRISRARQNLRAAIARRGLRT